MFLKLNGLHFLSILAAPLDRASVTAAYIGASNGDRPEFYQLFKSAMENIGNTDCRMIHSDFSKTDQASLESADVILLAGGDVERGWRVFESVGLHEIISRKYKEGALLIGISAGATQLGLRGYREEQGLVTSLFSTFKIVPYIIGAHEEKEEWRRLGAAVLMAGGNKKGIGIPLGGGMIYRANGSVEAIRYPLCEVSTRSDQIRVNYLMPNSGYADALFHH